MKTSYFENFYRYRWLMLGIMGVIYFFACLHRIAPTVIARDFILEFGADATALGLMSSTYFYLYAAVQPPVGMLSDTIGPRRVIAVFALIAGAGTVVFATAPDMRIAALGRALVGIGVGGIFVPGVKIFSRWYRATEFAGVTGIFLAMGNAGNLAASLPLTYLVLLLGWRHSFLGIGMLSLLLAFLGWLVLRDRPEEKGWESPSGKGEISSVQGLQGTPFPERLRLVLTSSSFWMVTLSYFFYGGSSLTFQGLWAIPFLMDIHGFTRVQAGSLLMLMPVGFIIGSPILGHLADKLPARRKGFQMTLLLVFLFCWSVLFLSKGGSRVAFFAPLFIIMGVCGGGALSIYMTMIKELFSPALTGTAMGLMNPAAFLATALFQPFTGCLMDAVGRTGSVYPLEAYRMVFAAFLISTTLALATLSLFRPLKKELSPSKTEFYSES